MNGKQAKILRKVEKRLVRGGPRVSTARRLKALKKAFNKMTHTEKGKVHADFR